MGGPVQSSLQKLIKKPNKRRHADDGSDQQPKLKQPSLLSRLAQSSSEQLAAPIASQQQSAALPDASQIPQSGQEHSTSSDVRSWTSDQLTGLCPVCGLKLSVQLLQQHVDEELSLLSDSNESCMDPVFADIRNQPSGLANRPAFFTKLHGHRSTTSRRHPAGQQKVMVLGGDVSMVQNHAGGVRRVRRRQVQPFDHYSSGGGAWDADMVGVEGVSDPDNTWEGLGTISLGT